MLYRPFGNTDKMVSAIGFGSTRFNPPDLADEAGLERCASLVVQAAEAGVNFFDSAVPYSLGQCEAIYRLAFASIKSERFVCGKSSSLQESTSDAVLWHIERSLKNMGLERFDFYYMWSVKSVDQYKAIMAKGGPYEGALRAKNQGLVGHILFSNHAPVSDALTIIADGAFEGVLISYSLLNYRANDALLIAAAEKNMGVAIMNPLGGGIIPQNGHLFANAVLPGDDCVAGAALKFVYAHPQIGTMLCGISNQRELAANTAVFSQEDRLHHSRIGSVSLSAASFSDFCTGCGYCADCPAGIPISSFMDAYSTAQFKTEHSIYNRHERETVKRTNVFRRLMSDHSVPFDSSENPCHKCGKCETVCTQRLPIMKTIDEIYGWAEQSCVSDSAKQARLAALLGGDYKRVGFYTAGGYTAYVLDLCKRFFGGLPFEAFVFDSNPLRWGTSFCDGLTVLPPAQIPALGLDLVLISNYAWSDEIYDELTGKYPDTPVVRLHNGSDVPWLF